MHTYKREAKMRYMEYLGGSFWKHVIVIQFVRNVWKFIHDLSHIVFLAILIAIVDISNYWKYKFGRFHIIPLKENVFVLFPFYFKL